MIGLSEPQNIQTFIRSYNDLEVYKKAFQVSLDLHKRSKDFPREELYGLTSQLRRSSKSICANVAEGFAKQQNSKAEFKRFLLIAIGSAHETVVWLEYCGGLDYLNQEEMNFYIGEYQSVTRMLQSFYSKA